MLSCLFLIDMADFLLAKRRRLLTPSNTPLLSTSHIDCVGMLQLHGGVEQSRGHRGGSGEAESRLRRSKYHVRWEELQQSEWERWVSPIWWRNTSSIELGKVNTKDVQPEIRIHVSWTGYSPTTNMYSVRVRHDKVSPKKNLTCCVTYLL